MFAYRVLLIINMKTDMVISYIKNVYFMYEITISDFIEIEITLLVEVWLQRCYV